MILYENLTSNQHSSVVW